MLHILPLAIVSALIYLMLRLLMGIGQIWMPDDEAKQHKLPRLDGGER
jgi:hypothetical protein